MFESLFLFGQDTPEVPAAFIAQAIAWAKSNPMMLAVVAGLLFFMRNAEGQQYISLAFSKAKSVLSSASAAESPADFCCTVEGRMSAVAHLIKHCKKCGHAEAADMLVAAIPALMDDQCEV